MLLRIKAFSYLLVVYFKLAVAYVTTMDYNDVKISGKSFFNAIKLT